MSADARRKSREKARAYRERMRAKGLRPVQLWVTDTRTPEFARKMRKEMLAIANSPGEADDQAFIDAISELKFE